ncbi:hypothetical protein BC359_18170 [Priestia flexa]|nr:hypothetical protein BC359_18170 [Priestia flexa]
MNGLAFDFNWNNEGNNVVYFVPRKEREEHDREILEIRKIRAKYSHIKNKNKGGFNYDKRKI